MQSHTISLSENLLANESAPQPKTSPRLLLAFGLIGIVGLIAISSQQSLGGSEAQVAAASVVRLEEDVEGGQQRLVYDGPESTLSFSQNQESQADDNNNINNSESDTSNNEIVGEDNNTNNDNSEQLDVDPFAAMDELVGKWVCSDVSSNFGSFMEKTGVSWMTRSMAKAIGYGKGSSKQTLTRDGHVMKIVSEGSPTITTLVDLQGQPLVTETSLGTSIVTGHMVNGELHITAKKGSKIVQTVHKMDSGVRVQAMSVEGVNAWRKWKRV